MAVSMTAPASGLLGLATELQLQILSFLDAKSILQVRLVCRGISNAAQDAFGKAFFGTITVNPFRLSLDDLYDIVNKEEVRRHFRALEIQPFLFESAQKDWGPETRIWGRVWGRVDHDSPRAKLFLNCLAELPGCVSITIRDFDRWGRTLEERRPTSPPPTGSPPATGSRESSGLAFPPPTDSLNLVLRAVSDPVKPMRMQSLRVVLSGRGSEGYARLQDLPIDVMQRSAFRQNWGENLRTLHLCPFLIEEGVQDPEPDEPFFEDAEDAIFRALSEMISAARSLESLVFGRFDSRARRLVHELATMEQFPRNLRHFVLKGGMGQDEQQQTIASTDLTRLLRRLGDGGKLEYLYLHRLFTDGDLEGWREALDTMKKHCCNLRNFTIETCGCFIDGRWEMLHFCQLYWMLDRYYGKEAFDNPCTAQHDHRFWGEMHTVEVSADEGARFEFLSMPWVTEHEDTAQGTTWFDRLHDIGVRYVRSKDTGEEELAATFDGISAGVSFASVGTADGRDCKGRHAFEGKDQGPKKRCGVGFLPDKDDDAWLDLRRACAGSYIELTDLTPRRRQAFVHFINHQTFYMDRYYFDPDADHDVPA